LIKKKKNKKKKKPINILTSPNPNYLLRRTEVRISVGA